MNKSLTLEETERLAEWFKTLGDPTRLKVMLCCCDCPTSVGDIALGCCCSNALASHHLKLLKAANIVKSKREGKQVFYELADDHILKMIKEMIAHVRHS